MYIWTNLRYRTSSVRQLEAIAHTDKEFMYKFCCSRLLKIWNLYKT